MNCRHCGDNDIVVGTHGGCSNCGRVVFESDGRISSPRKLAFAHGKSDVFTDESAIEFAKKKHIDMNKRPSSIGNDALADQLVVEPPIDNARKIAWLQKKKSGEKPCM